MTPRDYRRSARYKLRQRPREEWIRVELPASLRIIERDQWERVQAQLERNISFSVRNSRHVYLLRGLVECSGCGARYVGDPNHGRYYYRCHNRCKKLPVVREELLDQAVWEAIEEVLLNPDLVIEQIRNRERKMQSIAGQADNEIKEICQGIEKVDEEERRILEAYRAGILTPAILGRELEQLRARKCALIQRQTQLSAQSRAPNMPLIQRSVYEYCKEVAGRLSSFAESDRQRLLQLLIEKVIFKGEEVIIRGIIPAQRTPTQQIAEIRNPQSPESVLSIDGIAAMESWSHGLNSVDEIFFEVVNQVGKEGPVRSSLALYQAPHY
ncbi:MAG: recombinase zinc beta ribbon domain-containing protein [Acidobacteria bacterium]|nr:recombinase zinc beta ribbon domain-containing protein [Acidobacteriota bacterium]